MDLPIIIIQLTWIIPIESSGCHCLQFVLEFAILPLKVNDNRIQELNLYGTMTTVALVLLLANGKYLSTHFLYQYLLKLTKVSWET